MLDHRIFTFLTLYDEMNYRKTAEKLNMTQPGVTQHIHYLENYYNTKLFQYDGKTLSRTHQAQVLKHYFDSLRAEESAILEKLCPIPDIHLHVGATKTIGEFVIVSSIRRYLSQPGCNIDLAIDNTENLLQMLEKSEIDFAIVEGVFDKSKYHYHLYKKENFLGICSNKHPFAGKSVSLEDALLENVIVREKGSGTRRLLQQAVNDKGFSLDSFRRCSTISNFSVICEIVAKDNAITFAYEPIAHCRDDLATFTLEDIQIKGEFNFVYCNERIARPKIKLIFDGENI